MLELSDLPILNASLNGTALVLLLCGYVCIKRKHLVAHKRLMMGAYAVSIAFMASYLTYRFAGEEKRFGGSGWIRPIYFTILITHVTLAATVPVLASLMLYWGLRGRIERHRRLAKWAFPIWVYVSLTGVLVYLLLFQLYQPAGPVLDT